jgi:hypothetical protein
MDHEGYVCKDQMQELEKADASTNGREEGSNLSTASPQHYKVRK